MVTVQGPPWALFLIVMAANLHPTLSSKSKYIVTAPAKARRGYPFTVNVALLYPSGPSTVEAAIQTLSKQVVVGPVRASFGSSSLIEQKTMTLSIPETIQGGKYYLTIESKSGIIFNVTKKLDVLVKTGIILIQTDKKVYKEGQTVHIRGAVISSVTKPLDSNLDIIIKDPKGNKLAHYKGVTPNLGVVSTDFKLVNDPAYGEWTIFIMATNTPEITATVTFKVEKYVLPKFSVDVTVPSFIKLYPGQNAGILTVDILAKYTYGKSVNGKAIVQVTSYSQHELLEKTLVNGQSSFSFTVTREHVSRWLNYQASVLVRVVEDVTAKVESAEKSVPMFMMPYKITFINDDGSFIYGMPRNIFVKVTDAAGGSIPSAERSALGVSVTFALSKNWVPNADLLPPLTLTMPDTGDVISAHVDIPTRLEMDNQTFSMMAELSYPSTTSQKNEKVTTETEYKYPIGTKTNHGISVGVVGVTNQIQSPETSVAAGQVITFRVTTTLPSAKVFYEVHAKGLLLANGHVNPATITLGPSIVDFGVPVTSKMAPNAVILVYTKTLSDEIIADAQSFSVSGLMKHHLNVRFDSDMKQVGDEAAMTVTADPNSVVFVGAIDKSVALLGTPNEIDLVQLLESLEDFDLTVNPARDNTDWGCGGCGIAFKRKRRDVETISTLSGVTTSSIIENAGVMMETNAIITKLEINNFMPEMAEDGMVALASGGDMDIIMERKDGAKIGGDSTEPVRKNFPETWIWTNITIASSGMNTSNFPVPDTITSWDVSAFAMNSQTGIDLDQSPPSLTVMKNMFVSLDLPFSVKNEEKFKLNIYVFNYFNNPLSVDVTLADSDDFAVVYLDLKGNETEKHQAYTKTDIQVPSNSSNGFFVWISPKKIGNIKLHVTAVSPKKTDIVEQTLLVEPEGITETGAISMAIKHDVNKTAEFTIPIALPEGTEVVAGSRSNYVSLTGDVMGPTIENLDSLVRQPCGCGEQNMITLVPSIFVRKYMEAVKDFVDQSLVDRTNKYMESGYQRELKYKHNDGSFSAFGESDPSGSSWLTAFVVKSFAKAKTYISDVVDEDLISASAVWLLNQLDERDHTFHEPGRVIHSEMMGGSNTKSTLAAYIYSSLKEGMAEMTLRTPNLDIKLALVLSAMEADYMLNKDTWVAQRKYFQLAILAYAFALGESSLTSDVLQKLEDLSQDQDDMMYWSTATQSVYKDNGRLYRSLPSGPSDIETASYVILAYTKLDNVIKGQRVLRWLMSQINGAGSFKSTQDTVIGLQAIAAISILIGKSSAGMNLTVDTDGILNKMLVVNDDNKFLYQKEKLPDDIMEVPFTISGRGVALLTLNWKYNVMRQPLNSTPTFQIKAKTTFVNSNVFDVEIYIRLLVSSSIGQMALVTYKAPSGFATNTDTIQGADRVENKDGKVIIYVSNMLMSRKEFRIQSTRDKDVASVKDEFVSAEMYYKPGSRSMVKYEIPEEVKLSACQLSKGENDVCPLPGNPSGAPVTTPTKLLLTLMSILMLLTNLN